MESDNGRLNFKAYIDNSELRNSADESKQILHGIGNRAEEEGVRIDNSLRTIGKAVAGIFAIGQIKAFATNVATVRGQFQQLEMAFKTMLGSEEKADALMSQLIKTAATTPFGMSDIAQASKQLLAYGVQADEVNETLIRLGDIAAGLSIPIGDLTYLYGTTMVQGRLFTQDLRQFTGRGIPLTEELAKQFGVTKDKVAELVTAGKVGFPEVKKAIEALTSEGGKFGGLMDAQSRTITGQISNIEDSIEQMFNELGKRSEGVISDSLGVVSKLVDNWENIGKALLVVISTYGAYKASVIAVAAAHKIASIWGQVQAFLALTKGITSAKDAMLLLNVATKANPIGLVLGVVSAAVSAFMLFRDSVDESTESLNREREEAKKFEEQVGAAAASMMSKYKQLQTEYKSCKNEHEKTEWIKNNKDKFNELGLSVNSVNTAENLFVKNTDQMLNAFKKRAEASAWQSKLEEAYAKRVERQMALEEKRDKIYAGALHKNGRFESADYESNYRNGNYYYTEKGAADARRELIENDSILKSLDKEIDKYASKVQTAGKEYSALIKTASSGTSAKTGPTKEENEKSAENKKRIAEEKKRLLEEAEERKIKIIQSKKDREEREKTAELEIRQAAIAGMKDGFEKQIKENELEYDRLMLANEKRKDEMVEKLRDEKVLEWLNKNPKATKEQELKFRQTITAADLSDKEKEQLQAFADIAAEIQKRRNEKALEEMLEDVLDYNQRREQIEKDYEERRKELYNGGIEENGLREGVSEGNVAELARQESDALTAIDEEFASREYAYQAWCEQIANMSIEQLHDVLAKAQEELAKLEQTGENDSKKIAAARAKVATAQDKINKASANNDTGVDKRSIKEWEDLYKTLNECCGSFKEIGEEIGGVAGNVVSSAGTIATSTLSMINGIMQLVNMAATGMQGTATAASAAISTVEKASVILSVISTAMQVATTIANMFNNDNQKQKEIEALQTHIDHLQWMLDNADILRLQSEYGTALERVNDEYKKYQTTAKNALRKIAKEHGALEYFLRSNTVKQESLRKSAEQLAKGYANVAYSADKALGSAKYDDAKAQLENIAQQQILINEQIEKERSKKKSDGDAIADYEQKIEELGKQAVDVINELVEDIIGGSTTDIANELSDAFFEAFQNGEDYAEAWGSKVNDIVSDVIKRMLVSQFLEEPLGEIFDKYKSKWFKEGNFVGITEVINSMSGFAADLNTVGGEFAAIWENLPDSVKNTFTTTADTTREASEKGIATASQESVDELNGRMTAVQGHTFSISENTKLLVANTGAILQSVVNIEAHTEAMSTRMNAVENNVKSVKDTLNDIAMFGIKVK